MTVIDQIFHKVAEIAIPHFFITVEFSASGTEMPEHIEAFLQEKYEVILRGANEIVIISDSIDAVKVITIIII